MPRGAVDMGTLDAVTVIAAILFAGLGFAIGFGRTLKFFTKGIFGFVLSIFACATFGGMIQGIPAVAEWIAGLNASLGEAWSFLGTIHLATVIYYIVLFFVMQLLRILIVKLIAGVFSIDVLVMRIINRILGMLLMVAAVLLLTLLVFALIELFGGDIYPSLEGSFLGTLYRNNPVRFS